MLSRGLTLLLALACAFPSAKAAATTNGTTPYTVICGQYDTVTSPSGQYRFGNNEWGKDNSGAQCVSVNQNYTSFNVIWKWTANASLVHGYPNIKLNQDSPVMLSNLSSLTAQLSWSFSPSSNITSAYDANALTALSAKANVAFDMFLDLNSTTSQSTTKPQYEIMIWIGTFGGAVPIGFATAGVKPTHNIGNNVFTLYNGSNDHGQFVYTWLADSNITQFSGDVSPLIHYLWRHNYISSANYMGDIQFGSETFHATSNVTFSVKDIALAITKGTPAADSAATHMSMTKMGWLKLCLGAFIICVLQVVL